MMKLLHVLMKRVAGYRCRAQPILSKHITTKSTSSGQCSLLEMKCGCLPKSLFLPNQLIDNGRVCTMKRFYSDGSEEKHVSSSNIKVTQNLGELIYKGQNNKMVKLVKLFSLSTSAVGMCLQPYLITEMIGTSIAVKLAVAISSSFFVFGTPMLLHFLCKRYVIKMYYNSDTKVFTATRLNFFAREKQFSFQAHDIVESTPSPLSNFAVGSIAFLVDTDIIRQNHPDAYIVFMRYDEPIDLGKFTDMK